MTADSCLGIGVKEGKSHCLVFDDGFWYGMIA
jgi:hypothetical protein